KNIKSKYGVYAVLGNHDGHLLVEPLEAIGVRVLVNEYNDLKINNDDLRIIGTDDVNSFYTKRASEVLTHARNKFSICLVHSPDIFEEASMKGADLYLCGHTHGGQICLPGGIPLISHTSVSRRYTKGLWYYGNMIGYTSSGVGISAVPLRYNSRPEIIIHTLSK
ncbi:MAG: metallophosphoesterase, partial [Bdellovibrionales bacterium]|nr:metallophosphoesterase [Bdellovibrionales bacterium]